jgi:hypothetical protein
LTDSLAPPRDHCLDADRVAGFACLTVPSQRGQRDGWFGRRRAPIGRFRSDGFDGRVA